MSSKRGRCLQIASQGGGRSASSSSSSSGGKEARREITGVSELVSCWERAVMPIQPMLNGRVNGCWVSPVVCIVRYYNKHGNSNDSSSSGNSDKGVDNNNVIDEIVTVESVLATVGEHDKEESVGDVLEVNFGLCPAIWKRDGREVWYDTGESTDEDGGMFEVDGGVGVGGAENVSAKWWDALKNCIGRNDVAILLCERLEATEARARGVPATHYLLILGYEEVPGRRGHVTRFLLVKDPMEGDVLLRGELQCEVYNSGKMLLRTLKPEGGALDQFRPLECVHMGGYVNANRGPAAISALPLSSATTTTTPATATAAAASAASGVIHDEIGGVFVLQVDREKVFLEYDVSLIAQGTLDIVHTFTPEALRGNGLAAIVCDAAYNWGETQGYDIIASCSYVADFYVPKREARRVV